MIDDYTKVPQLQLLTSATCIFINAKIRYFTDNGKPFKRGVVIWNKTISRPYFHVEHEKYSQVTAVANVQIRFYWSLLLFKVNCCGPQIISPARGWATCLSWPPNTINTLEPRRSPSCHNAGIKRLDRWRMKLAACCFLAAGDGANTGGKKTVALSQGRLMLVYCTRN